MLPYSMIAGGTFTSTISTQQDITLVSQNPPDYIVMRNLGSSSSTGWGEASDAQEIEWFWQRSMAQGTAKGIRQTSDATNPAMIASFLSSDGISTYDTTNPPTFAGLAATAITAANPPVVSMANTGTIAVGDRVRLTNVLGQQQVSGMVFYVTAVTANVSITLGMADFSGFAAASTGATVIKLITGRMYPKMARIMTISQANPAVVTFMQPNDFTVGEEISFRVVNVPGTATYGMTQINNLKGVVTAVTNSATVSSITTNIDSSGFTAFAYPTSANAALATQPAFVIPAGSGVIPSQNPPGMNIVDAFDNRNTRLIHCGASMFANGSTGDIWEWRAYKYDEYNNA